MPDSFYEYLVHAAQENIQRTLWSDHGINTSSVEGKEFPDEFYEDVKAALDRVQAAYEAEIRTLRSSQPMFPWKLRRTDGGGSDAPTAHAGSADW
jgi:hypothetical protein